MENLNYEKEEWKDIKGFEGLYQVSNLGRIKSFYRLEEKILKPLITKGYYQVCLFKQAIKKKYLVHRLVWSAFNGSIPEGLQVNHINEIKSDNRLENLNLMTSKENCNWGTGIERRVKNLINGKKSKPVLQFDLNDNFIKEYPSIRQVYRETGFAFQNIYTCCKGKLKQAYGYKWRYKE